MEQHMDRDMDASNPKSGNLAQAWLVLLLALCFGMALAAVQIGLSGIIADNKLNETLAQIPELVQDPGKAADPGSRSESLEILPGTITIPKAGKTVSYPIYRVGRAGQPVGWVIKGAGQGYADKIELLLGLDPKGTTITGLFILEQKETPGLGNKIIDAVWRDQFIRKQTARPLEVGKNSHQDAGPGHDGIDAVTGATISSRAVTTIVNGLLDDVKGRLNPEFIRLSERKS